ncbi:helix-turn-helix domain-containing protein [Trinickia fusca]|uniref:Helix-turn-helix domain-containing protein n=1 Tax=Trinickia fusca TaxID=2419777 RepID=A0A494XXV6_9BURK|nr:helix-turn-helix domain-containing protein [Trinickia fusca]RKP52423.1 helix-turn-helix domain-containing protein [Trinickia fusca]
MSEQQHPQSDGTQPNAGRSGSDADGYAAHQAGQTSFESLAAAGARLAQLREAKGWSVDDVSARLKVSPPKMRALEAGDISHLPGTTFALGVVRAYAKMLGTDPAPFTQALRREKGEPEPDLSMPASTGADMPRGRVSVSLGSTQRHRSWWWGVAAVVVGLVALVMWRSGGESHAWLARLKASANGVAANASSASAAAQSQAVVQQPVIEQGASVASGVALEASAASEASGAAAMASATAPATAASASAASAQTTTQAAAQTAVQTTTQPATAQTPAPASAASAAVAKTPAAQTASETPAAKAASAAPAAKAPATAQEASASQAASAAAAPALAGTATVGVTVTQDSWFSVRDKDGKEVFSGLVHAGDTKEVSGVPPFKVTAGNRAGLESMTFDGQPVDAAKYSGKGNVARFSLP